MIEESYVSFDTAKMLKEAGFDVECDWFYINDGSVDTGIVVRSTSPRDHNMATGFSSRPTQALAARWLCEHKMIEVSVAYCRRRKSWYYWVGYLDCEDEDVTFGFNYASRQYAMEAGLQEAIKLIKK